MTAKNQTAVLNERGENVVLKQNNITYAANLPCVHFQEAQQILELYLVEGHNITALDILVNWFSSESFLNEVVNGH